MPTQVSRPPSVDPLRSSRTSPDRYSSPAHHDPLHDPSCDSRTKYNPHHREALRLALGSILTPKRPFIPGSRSSSGTTTPAYSFSGSSGTYTPATPSVMTHTLSFDASNSQEHPWARHLSHPHHHPSHPPSKLVRVELQADALSTDGSSSVPASTSSLRRHSPPPIPPQLFRSLSRSPSNAPSPRTSPWLHPTISPPAHPPPMITDTGEFRPTLPAPTSPVTTNNDESKISAEYRLPSPSLLPPGDVPVLSAVSTTNGTGSPDQVLCQQYPGGLKRSGAPRAKFIQTLQGKSAWDALIHGSFS